MRTSPDLIEIVTGDRGMLRGIEACVKQECLVSVVTLIYASIDSLAALTRPIEQDDTTSVQFIDWANRYLFPASKLPCTSTDLYGARCGILHTHGPDSKIRRKDGAKALIYCWRSGPQADARVPLPKDSVVVVVEDLIDAFRAATQRFLEAMEADPNLAIVVDHHLPGLLCYAPFEVAVHSAA
jgi:hypothetical protein